MSMVVERSSAIQLAGPAHTLAQSPLRDAFLPTSLKFFLWVKAFIHSLRESYNRRAIYKRDLDPLHHTFEQLHSTPGVRVSCEIVRLSNST